MNTKINNFSDSFIFPILKRYNKKSYVLNVYFNFFLITVMNKLIYLYHGTNVQSFLIFFYLLTVEDLN